MSQSNVEFEGFRWYVFHTYSGYENKVMNDLMTKVKNIGMEDEILEAVIPMESVTEIRDVETVEKDPVTVTGAEAVAEAITGAEMDAFIPENTTVRVEDGRIVEIVRVYIP